MGLRLRISGLGFEVQGLGLELLGVLVAGRVWYRLCGLGCQVVLGFRALGVGCEVLGFGAYSRSPYPKTSKDF